MSSATRYLFAAALVLAALGWSPPAEAQQSTPMLVTEPAVSYGTTAPAVRGGSVEYLYDDGDGDTNQGPPSSFDPDMLWGNYYLTEPGGEVITEIHVAFGPTFPSLEDGPVTFWLLDDPDMDFDPLNATALVSVEATPDVFNDNFFTVQIPPTEVSGAFFVGASALLEGGEDRPARVDTGHPGDRSWFCYAPDISEVIDDLASAPYCSRQDGPDVVFPGAFMIRATGVPGGGGEGELVFEPSPLVAMLESGETGTETVTITNTSGTPVEYVFSGYADPDRPAERQAATPDAGMASWHGAKTERDPRHGSAVRFGEGGLVFDRPVNGLEFPVHDALLDHVRKDVERLRLVLRRHGEIGVRVIGERHEALHLRRLQFDEFFGVLLAVAPDRRPAHVVFERFELLHLARLDRFGHDLVFDRKTVAVPAGDVRARQTGHRAGPHHKILQAFVEQVAEVDRAVGVGGAVVEDVSLRSRPGLLNAVVQPDLLPPFDARRLVLNEVGLHREGGSGKIEGLLVVGL